MTDRLTQLRAELPAVQQAAFLNTGSFGPLPARTAEALAQAVSDELTGGRAGTSHFLQIMENGQAVREAFAALFNVSAADIALTHHTTDGMNIGSFGFNWQPGDEVATTTLEHEGGLYPLYIAQTRYGVKINFADVGLGADPLDAIDAALTPKTRLLSISHVSYSAGTRFPLPAIIELAHRKNIPVLVDGAQSAGVFALDLAALDVDFYAVPGQKWLCGPDGIGALYVNPARQEALHPTYVAYGSVKQQDWQGGYTLSDGARRYETGGIYAPVLAGMRASLEWFLNDVTPAWAYERIAGLAAHARQVVGALDGVRLITPENRQASLLNFLPVGWSPAQMAGLVDALHERGYIIRSIPHEPYCLRVSCGFYNTEAEIDGLGAALAACLADGPEAVTIPDWAKMFNLGTQPVS